MICQALFSKKIKIFSPGKPGAAAYKSRRCEVLVPFVYACFFGLNMISAAIITIVNVISAPAVTSDR